MRITLVTIAAACHAINAAFCEANGDTSQPTWGEAPEWQRNSAINGVALHVTDQHMSPAASHEAWLAQKTREGWSYGEKKDPIAKTHPCFVPYDELPPTQKAKDYLFKATVAQFVPFLPGSELAAAAEIAQAFNAAAETAPAEIKVDETAKPMTNAERKAAKKAEREKLAAEQRNGGPIGNEGDPTNSAENTTDAPEVEKATESA